MSIRIGIFGYGNLGRGVEAAIAQNPDMELGGRFYPQRSKNALHCKQNRLCLQCRGCCRMERSH